MVFREMSMFRAKGACSEKKSSSRYILSFSDLENIETKAEIVRKSTEKIRYENKNKNKRVDHYTHIRRTL